MHIYERCKSLGSVILLRWVRLSYLGPVSCSFPSWVPSGCTAGRGWWLNGHSILCLLIRQATVFHPLLHASKSLLYLHCRPCFPLRGPPHLLSSLSSLGQEDLLEKEMATHSSTLAWKIPWSGVDYSPWDRKESDTTERLHFHFLTCYNFSLSLATSLAYVHSFCPLSCGLQPILTFLFSKLFVSCLIFNATIYVCIFFPAS